MVEVLQYLEPLLNNFVGLVSTDMGNESDPTGIVFVGGIVESLGVGVVHFFVQRKSEPWIIQSHTPIGKGNPV
jgi:hypothetical protein